MRLTEDNPDGTKTVAEVVNEICNIAFGMILIGRILNSDREDREDRETGKPLSICVPRP